MKAIIIILTVTVVAVLGQITDEQRAKLRQYKESCISETGVDPTVVENAKKGELAESDGKLVCFSDCLLRKIGIITADGDINWDVARSKVPPNVPQEQIDLIYNNCKDIDGNGCEKGAKLFQCFLRNKHFSLLA
ncbi:general odorant-binding protein 56d-like [Anoplolepis gracilipes]|uniref:general odorant-binding protein 56d-like n=1 Tax=Anoplolepis gracilipes TaxID=354296 RepID=UPI003BA38A19